MRQRSREKVIGALLAVLVTTIIVIEFLVDSKINTAPPPRVVYADSWSVNRTDAEIVAQQKVDQAKRTRPRRRSSGSSRSWKSSSECERAEGDARHAFHG